MVASERVDEGEYEVRFERDVDRCAYAVTQDHAGGFSFISLLPLDTSPRVVGVTTTDRGGFVRDSQFHLVVTC